MLSQTGPGVDDVGQWKECVVLACSHIGAHNVRTKSQHSGSSEVGKSYADLSRIPRWTPVEARTDRFASGNLPERFNGKDALREAVRRLTSDHLDPSLMNPTRLTWPSVSLSDLPLRGDAIVSIRINYSYPFSFVRAHAGVLSIIEFVDLPKLPSRPRSHG